MQQVESRPGEVLYGGGAAPSTRWLYLRVWRPLTVTATTHPSAGASDNGSSERPARSRAGHGIYTGLHWKLVETNVAAFELECYIVLLVPNLLCQVVMRQRRATDELTW